VGVLVVGLAAAAGALAQRSSSAASSAVAEVLRERDPGKRLGGNTIVVTGNGTRIVGVPHRPNFIIALGNGDTIVAGGRNDQIGALGRNVTLVAGTVGHELLIGGTGGKVIVDGAGHDLTMEMAPRATIVVSSPADRIVVQGRNDRVECAGESSHDVIYAGATDRVDASCAKRHDRVLPTSDIRPLVQSPRGRQAVGSYVSGSGSNDDPYAGFCASYVDVCTPGPFAARSLTGLWTNEYVPAYKCPSTQPYLRAVDYAPAGTKLPRGVEVKGLGPIGVSITGVSTDPGGRANGTLTGGTDSSATNWTTGTASYEIVLHCAKEPRLGYHG
jgi:Ca2+-binding RTX toxin-like protein